MAIRWLQTGILEGCMSWDRMLLKLLSIILGVALAARCGDVARSTLYKEGQCLCWKGIQLQLRGGIVGEPSVQDLEGEFTLRFLKGKK